MSKCCLFFDDGHLVCGLQHLDYRNCDLWKKDHPVAQEEPTHE